MPEERGVPLLSGDMTNWPSQRRETHLAVGLGREAIVAGYTVLFTGAMELVANLAKAQADGRLEERLTHFAKPKLLIVDELGYLPLEPDAAHLFFQLASRRYERGAMLIISNRAVGEWGSVFGDAVVATAIFDRLLHHSHVITIRGDSYRLREKRRSGLLQKPAAEPQSSAPSSRSCSRDLRATSRPNKCNAFFTDDGIENSASALPMALIRVGRSKKSGSSVQIFVFVYEF